MKALFQIRWRRTWAVARWVVMAAALPLVWACTARTLEPPQEHPIVVTNNVYKASINNELDILFMIDNSQSMAPLQDKLLTNFPVFMNVLKALPMGLPDVHVAVISSDAGPGTYDLPNIHCSFQGDKGLFQTAPRGTCTASPLAAGQTFLAASNNQAMANYTGDITDAFTCIAALGEGGCGFESQLKSVRWALDTDPGDDDPAPDGTIANNNGFLRPEAYLGVILVTNEDDCSVPTYSDLIDPSSIHNSDRYGPLWSFRCNEYGHLCTNGGAGMPAVGAPAASTATPVAPPVRGVNTGLMGCESNDNATSDSAHPPNLETRVADEISFLKNLKADPSQILVAAITGPVTPYSTNLIPQTLSDGTTEMQPNTLHSCMQDTGEYADASIRIQQWVEAFGNNGIALTICAPTFAPALMQIATALSQLLGPQCVTGKVQNNTAGAPDCAVNDRYVDTTTNKTVEMPIQSCASNGNVPPCWTLGADPAGMACLGANQQLLSVNRTGLPMLQSGVNTDVACTLCPAGSTDPGC